MRTIIQEPRSSAVAAAAERGGAAVVSKSGLPNPWLPSFQGVEYQVDRLRRNLRDGKRDLRLAFVPHWCR